MAANPQVVRALDVEEMQVALNFAGDAFEWHQRILMVNGGSGKWIVLTPDLDLENDDLTDHVVVALSRAAPVPARVRNSFYGFDPVPDEDLRRLRSEARALARAVGFDITGTTQPSVNRWIIADTAHERFGKEIDPGICADPARFLERDHAAFAPPPPHAAAAAAPYKKCFSY